MLYAQFVKACRSSEDSSLETLCGYRNPKLSVTSEASDLLPRPRNKVNTLIPAQWSSVSISGSRPEALRL